MSVRLGRPFFPLKPSECEGYGTTCAALACVHGAYHSVRGMPLCPTCYALVKMALDPHDKNDAGRWDQIVFGCGCGPDPCPDCAFFARAERRVVMVGERLNLSGCVWRPSDPAMELDFRLLRRLGALRWGPSRDRLLAAGVRWDAAVNLLMPDAVGKWEAGRASEVAEAIAPELNRYDVVILLGARVEDAFRGRLRRWLRLPHPNGRNREWNNPDLPHHVRRLFRMACTHSNMEERA